MMQRRFDHVDLKRDQKTGTFSIFDRLAARGAPIFPIVELEHRTQ